MERSIPVLGRAGVGLPPAVARADRRIDVVLWAFGRGRWQAVGGDWLGLLSWSRQVGVMRTVVLVWLVGLSPG